MSLEEIEVWLGGTEGQVMSHDFSESVYKNEYVLDPAPNCFARNKYVQFTIEVTKPDVSMTIDPNIYTKGNKKKTEQRHFTHVLNVTPERLDGSTLALCEKCTTFLQATEAKCKKDCTKGDKSHFHFNVKIMCGHGALADDLWLSFQLTEPDSNNVIPLGKYKITLCASRGDTRKRKADQLKFHSVSVTRFLNRLLSWVLF